tara:strand:+ start:2757 stop:2999 length:243 start_codon:yes stop_codon:yes gene_type:complete
MITRLQRDVLFFVAEFSARERIGPSYRDIADGIGQRSTSGVHNTVARLKARGFLASEPRLARSIGITAKGAQWIVDTKVD